MTFQEYSSKNMILQAECDIFGFETGFETKMSFSAFVFHNFPSERKL